MEQYLDKMTAIMRDADQRFETTGGSTRHYMRDLFLPMMEAAGLTIVDATPAPQDVLGGPWKFDVHHEAGVPETGCSGDVYGTLTDGKVTLYIDTDDSEDYDAEKAVCDVLNKFKIKLDYDHSAEMVAGYFQQELKRVQEAQAGVWVKITTEESLPPLGSPNKYITRGEVEINGKMHLEVKHLSAEEIREDCQGFEWYEYLAEKQ